ncbi:MAG: DUF1653 domain-containing protein [Clostridiales bacterium]|nr:DUF1653 domain-containing protein [Clostridiales bacterium]
MEFQPGRYRHFKGNEYELLYVARHSETMEEMVVYRALYGEHGVWVRPASMWNETVERDGKTYRRFTKIED